MLSQIKNCHFWRFKNQIFTSSWQKLEISKIKANLLLEWFIRSKFDRKIYKKIFKHNTILSLNGSKFGTRHWLLNPIQDSSCCEIIQNWPAWKKLVLIFGIIYSVPLLITLPIILTRIIIFLTRILVSRFRIRESDKIIKEIRT